LSRGGNNLFQKGRPAYTVGIQLIFFISSNKVHSYCTHVKYTAKIKTKLDKMDLKEIYEQSGFSLVVQSGFEFHGACPVCGGYDRFIIQSDKNRYICRNSACALNNSGHYGDIINFLRTYKGLSYKEACRVSGKKLNFSNNSFNAKKKIDTKQKKAWLPKVRRLPNLKWQGKAFSFILWSYDNLKKGVKYKGLDINQWLKNRGITESIIDKYKLGWNIGIDGKDISREPEAWGIEKKFFNEKLWLKIGLVIPIIKKNRVISCQIRQFESNIKNRYIFLKGSPSLPMIFNNNKSYTCVVESRLCGILLQEHTSDLINIIALNSANGKPDIEADDILRNSKVILNALDNGLYDNSKSGTKEVYGFWEVNYPQNKRLPPLEAKDPSDMYKAGKYDLHDWIEAGL